MLDRSEVTMLLLLSSIATTGEIAKLAPTVVSVGCWRKTNLKAGPGVVSVPAHGSLITLLMVWIAPVAVNVVCTEINTAELAAQEAENDELALFQYCTEVIVAV
jgi:hypothetical protein